MIKKSVISLISYDSDYLPNSIKSYYEYVDEIILGLDEQRITWSGNQLKFDEAHLWDELKKIDKDRKIQIIEANFHGSQIPMHNEVHERNILKSHCTNDWIFSFDADEVVVNPRDFFVRFIPLFEPYYKKADLLFTWFLPYKAFEDDYLMIANEDNTWFRGDTQGFVTHKDNAYVYGRWTNNKYHLLSPMAILHWSFCRSEENLQTKINNFGHSEKTKDDPFFGIWKQITLENYTSLRNFKSSGFGANQWNKLIKIPKSQFEEIARREALRIFQ